MKKTLSLFLAVVMALSIFAGLGMTAEAQEYGKIPYVRVTVTEPVAGAKATATQVSVSSEHSNEVFFAQINLSDNDYNFINGIQWHDQTTGKYLGYNDTFVAGHTYNVSVIIASGSEYRFDYPKRLTSQTVNGNTAEGDYLFGTLYEKRRVKGQKAVPLPVFFSTNLLN